MLHGVRVQVPPFAPNNMMKIKGLVCMMGLSLFCIYIKKRGYGNKRYWLKRWWHLPYRYEAWFNLQDTLKNIVKHTQQLDNFPQEYTNVTFLKYENMTEEETLGILSENPEASPMKINPKHLEKFFKDNHTPNTKISISIANNDIMPIL